MTWEDVWLARIKEMSDEDFQAEIDGVRSEYAEDTDVAPIADEYIRLLEEHIRRLTTKEHWQAWCLVCKADGNLCNHSSIDFRWVKPGGEPNG